MDNVDDIVKALLEVKLDDIDAKQSFVTEKLVSLAVELRNEDNRSNPKVQAGLTHLVLILKKANDNGNEQVTMEALRALINLVAYNQENSQALIDNQQFNQVVQHLVTYENEVTQRVVLLLGNLIISDPDKLTSKKISESVAFKQLLEYFLREVKRGEIVLGLVEFLYAVITTSSVGIDSTDVKVGQPDLLALTALLKELVVNLKQDLDIDLLTFCENLTRILYYLAEYEKLEFTGETLVAELFEVLELLDMDVPQELFDVHKDLNRKVFAVASTLIANVNNSNKNDIGLALDQLSASKNNYVKSSCMLVLANSITSLEDRDHLLDLEPNLTEKIIKSIQPPESDLELYLKKLQLIKGKDTLPEYQRNVNFFTEPLLGQSLFHLLRNLIVSSTIKDKYKPAFVAGLHDNFPVLEKLILVNFNSMFFTRVNLTLILRFLRNLLRNFFYYDKQFLEINLRDIFVSLIWSYLSDKSLELDLPEPRIKIKEIGEQNYPPIHELIQYVVLFEAKKPMPDMPLLTLAKTVVLSKLPENSDYRSLAQTYLILATAVNEKSFQVFTDQDVSVILDSVESSLDILTVLSHVNDHFTDALKSNSIVLLANFLNVETKEKPRINSLWLKAKPLMVKQTS